MLLKWTYFEDFWYAVKCWLFSGSLSWIFHHLHINFNFKLIQRIFFVQMGYNKFMSWRYTYTLDIWNKRFIFSNVCLCFTGFENFLIIYVQEVVSKVLNLYHAPFHVGHDPKIMWTLFMGWAFLLLELLFINMFKAKWYTHTTQKRICDFLESHLKEKVQYYLSLSTSGPQKRSITIPHLWHTLTTAYAWLSFIYLNTINTSEMSIQQVKQNWQHLPFCSSAPASHFPHPSHLNLVYHALATWKQALLLVTYIQNCSSWGSV